MAKAVSEGNAIVGIQACWGQPVDGRPTPGCKDRPSSPAGAQFSASMSIKPALPALAAALLFGASTPLAKLLTGDVSPLLLAGLLYLGSEARASHAPQPVGAPPDQR